MSAESNQPTPAPDPVWARKRGLAVAGIAFVAIALLCLRVPLASEVRYLESAREMVESGDWIVPRLAYVPYFEKPIFLYWAAAASRFLFGDSLVATRLPTILAATISIWITFAMARELLGAKLGARVALMVLGSTYFLVMGSTLTTDAVFACWLWATWYAYWRSLADGARAWKWAYCFALAFAFMTKGPLALILFGGSTVTFHVLDAPWRAVGAHGVKDWVRRIALGIRAALAGTTPVRAFLVLLAVNLPWTWLVWRHDVRLLSFFYIRENLKAFFDGNVHHTQHFGFYGLVVLGAFVPWAVSSSIGFLAAIRARFVDGIRGRDEAAARSQPDRARTYLFGIVLFTLCFLQASSAKLATYPLPIVPALTILSADMWCSRTRNEPRWLRWSLFASLAAVVVGAAGYMIAQHEVVKKALDGATPSARTTMIVCLITVGCAWAASAVLALMRRTWPAIALSGGATFALLLVGSLQIPDLALEMNVEPLARVIAAGAKPDDRLVVTSQFAQDYTLQYVVHRRFALIGKGREIGMGHYAEVTTPDDPIPADPYSVAAENLPSNPWLWTHAQLVERWRDPQRIWLVCSDTEHDLLVAEGVDVHLLGDVKDARLCSNRD